MNYKLVGNNLTYSMLEHGKEEVWCAVSNDSNDHAMGTVDNVDHDFLRYITSSENDLFFSEDGSSWQYAVPVKTKALTQNEVGL